MTDILDLKSKNDWESRVDFLHSLTASAEDIDRIIGKYDLPRAPEGMPYGTGMVLCGFNRCNEKHYRGFLLKLKDGRETIIGRDCGRKKLGVTFEEIEATFKADETRQARKSVLHEIKAARESIISEAESIFPDVLIAENRILEFQKDLNKFHVFWKKLEEAHSLGGKVLIELEKSEWTESSGAVDLVTGATVRYLDIIFSDSTVHRRSLRIKVISWLKNGIEEEINQAGEDVKKLGELVIKATEVRDIVKTARSFCENTNQFFTLENLSGLNIIRDQQLPKAERSNALDRALQRQMRACTASNSSMSSHQ